MGCCCCYPKKVTREKANAETQTEEEEENEDNLLTSKNKKENLKEEDNIIIEKKTMPYEIELKDYLDEEIDDTNVFNKSWYSDIEKDKIIYSKRSIIALFNFYFDDTKKEFKEIYNKGQLIMSIKSTGSFITEQFQVIKSMYTIPKNSLPEKTTIRMLSKYLLNIKERSSWDTQIKSYKLIEGSEDGIEVKCIVQNWSKSPMFLISERDIVEKRFDFYHEDQFFTFESSVNDDYIPLENKVTRINDFIFIENVYEDNDNFVIKSISQMNAKVSLPQSIINSTLSSKLIDFYKGMIKAMNQDFKSGKLIFEDNDGNKI